MPEEKELPRPHGDPIQGAAGNPGNDPDDNQAQVQSDAQPDAGATTGREETDRDGGALRKRQYKDGADLVSGLD